MIAATVLGGLLVPLAASAGPADSYWRMIAYGDNRGANSQHRLMLRTVRKIQPEIILNAGDYLSRVPGGTFAEFRREVDAAFGPFETFRKRFYPAVGNHEQALLSGRTPHLPAAIQALDLVDVKSRVKAITCYGDYYFVHKNVHFVVLFCSDKWLKPAGPDRARAWEEQTAWLFETLSTIRKQAPNAGLVVMSHKRDWFLPVVNQPRAIGSKWAAMLKHYKVDLALAGDLHDYYASADGPTLKMRCGSLGYGVPLYLDIRVHADGFAVTARTPAGRVLFYPLYPTRWWKPFGRPARQVAKPGRPASAQAGQ